MTPQEITEGNKLIAEFMGGIRQGATTGKEITDKVLGRSKEWFIPNHGYFDSEDLKYDSDWNWLMEVVEKIESLFNGNISFIIKDNRVFIELNCQYAIANDIHLPDEFYSGSHQSKRNAVFYTLINFITWYNAQNK